MTRVRSAGFTLLEVVVAMAILCMSLMAIFNMNAGAIRMHTYTKRLTVATLLARSKMTDIEQQLYDKGFKSIGCAPCTRAIPEGQDGRSGRWWWETGAPKECGMHCSIETGGFEHELAALLGRHSGTTPGA